MTYIELTTNADVARYIEADAREYAREEDKPFPYPSERYSKGCPVSSLPENWIRQHTSVFLHYRDGGPRLPGGIVVVTAETQARAGKTVRLGDGSDYKLASTEMSFAELSAKAKETLRQ